MFSVQFYGVRGSTPSCDPDIVGYGGNTSCVLVSVPDMQPIVLDLGTGLRSLGLDLMAARNLADPQPSDVPLQITALLTHLHWDHVQGLPFFAPILESGCDMEILGPPLPGKNLEDAIHDFMKPPLFPVSIDCLPGRLSFGEVSNGSFTRGSATITAFPVPHLGATNGYRIEAGDASLAYIPDHQQPTPDPTDVPAEVVANCKDVDILIHDAQYDCSEFEGRSDWGHCTAEFAVAMATACGAKRLVLFHHDPTHTDHWIEESLVRARTLAPPELEVLAAAEGLKLTSGLSVLAEY